MDFIFLLPKLFQLLHKFFSLFSLQQQVKAKVKDFPFFSIPLLIIFFNFIIDKTFQEVFELFILQSLKRVHTFITIINNVVVIINVIFVRLVLQAIFINVVRVILLVIVIAIIIKAFLLTITITISVNEEVIVIIIINFNEFDYQFFINYDVYIIVTFIKIFHFALIIIISEIICAI